MQITEKHAKQLQRRLAILSPKSSVTVEKDDGEYFLSVDEGEWEVRTDEHNKFILYALVTYPGSYENPPEQDWNEVGTFLRINEVAASILTAAIHTAIAEVDMDESHEETDAEFDAMNNPDPHNVD
jgi:hypothetical protein